jgi:hypothetical protein
MPNAYFMSSSLDALVRHGFSSALFASLVPTLQSETLPSKDVQKRQDSSAE